MAILGSCMDFVTSDDHVANISIAYGIAIVFFDYDDVNIVFGWGVGRVPMPEMVKKLNLHISENISLGKDAFK
jgi:hypothetical protein